MEQRRQPPWSEQDGDHRERHGGRAPDGAVAHQPGADREPGTHDDQREDDAEPEQQRRERRPEREEERAPPRRPPPAVGLRVGEAERGVGEPRQQGGHGDHAETTLAPGAADDRDQRVRHGTPREQRPGEATLVDEPADHAQEPPGAPEGERHGQHQQRRDGGAGTAAEEGRRGCQGQHVRRRRDGGALTDRVPGLRVQPPPVARGIRDRGQRAAGHGAEGVAGPHQGQDHEQGHRDGHGVGEEPDDQPGVLTEPVVLVLDHAARRLTGLRELRGPAALGHVGGLVRGRREQVAEEVEPVAVGQPARRQQPSYLAAVRDLVVASGAPRGRQLARAGVHRHQRGQLVESLADLAGQQEPDHPQHGAERQPDDLERQRPAGRVRQQRVQRSAALLVVRVPAGDRRTPDAAVRGLGVEDHGLRDDDRAVAGLRGAPAEVDVVAEDRELAVEAAQLVQDRPADQHPGGVDGEDLADVVVLALVVLAALEARLASSGAGDGDAQLEQPPQRWPLPQLGAEDLGAGVLDRCGEQCLERSRIGVRVVVQDPDPLAVADVLEAEGDGFRERRGARSGDDGAEGGGEQVDALVPAAGVDGHHAVSPDPLAAYPVDDRGEPAGTVMADEEHGDRRIHGQRH